MIRIIRLQSYSLLFKISSFCGKIVQKVMYFKQISLVWGVIFMIIRNYSDGIHIGSPLSRGRPRASPMPRKGQ